MANRFKKKCTCHGKVFLVEKVSWKKRGKGEPYCLSEILKANHFYMPYIPLLEMVIP